MKVTLIDQGAGPVWYGADGSTQAYYRGQLPARCAGALFSSTLTVSIDDAPLESLPLDDDDETPAVRDRWIRVGRAHTLTIAGLGSPAIFLKDSAPPTVLANLIEAITAAGGCAVVDFDIDVFHFEVERHVDLHWRLFTAYDRTRAASVRELTRLELVKWEGWKADYQRMARAARAVIVATPALAECVRPFNDRVHVVENCIDPADVSALSTRRLVPDEAWALLGFGGWWTHYDDLMSVWPALTRAAAAWPAPLALMGVHPRFAMRSEPGAYEHHGAPYLYLGFAGDQRVYYGLLRQFGMMVRPLVASHTNDRRSGQAWAEAALCGVPLVVTDAPPYALAEHNVTALKVAPDDSEGFERALLTLTHDAKLREGIAAAARAEARARHSVAARAPLWRATIATITGAPKPPTEAPATYERAAAAVRLPQIGARYQASIWQTPRATLERHLAEGRVPSDMGQYLEHRAFAESKAAWKVIEGRRTRAAAPAPIDAQQPAVRGFLVPFTRAAGGGHPREAHP